MNFLQRSVVTVKSRVFRVTILSTRLSSISTTSSEPFSHDEKFYGSARPTSREPLSPLQSIALTIYSASKAFIDPERHDMVAMLAEVTGKFALESMHDMMLNDPTGRRILQDRPLVTKENINIEALKVLPENTFGSAYASFLSKHGFDPDARSEVRYIPNPDLAYVMTRYRQSHDFFHVMTELPPTIPGELALKYVELFQTGLPVCALSATSGSMMLGIQDRNLWQKTYLPWAIQVGKFGKRWMNVYWEEHFQKDLKEFRNELGILVAPTEDISFNLKTKK